MEAQVTVNLTKVAGCGEGGSTSFESVCPCACPECINSGVTATVMNGC